MTPELNMFMLSRPNNLKVGDMILLIIVSWWFNTKTNQRIEYSRIVKKSMMTIKVKRLLVILQNFSEKTYYEVEIGVHRVIILQVFPMIQLCRSYV